MDYRLSLICGTDMLIPECNLVAHQPRIKEISFIGESDFFIGAQTLCLHKTMFIEDKTILDSINNFQIFMTIMLQDETKDKKANILNVLNLLFPSYKVNVTPNSLLFIKEGIPPITVDGNNFEALQEVLRLIFCMHNGPMDQQAFNPANDKAREIAQKLMRGRQRVAAQNGNLNVSVFSQYMSILTIGLGSMSLQDLTNLTMFQLYDLMERYTLYTAWDLDVRQRLAGGKPEGTPDNWMKNIH